MTDTRQAMEALLGERVTWAGRPFIIDGMDVKESGKKLVIRFDLALLWAPGNPEYEASDD